MVPGDGIEPPTHGYPCDDDDTGTITRLIAKRMRCYAVINEAYQKPKDDINKSPKRETPSKKDFRINCNSLREAKKYLKKEYFSQILNYKEEIKKKYRNPIVVHIHGMKTENMEGYVEKKKIDSTIAILIGYGQDKEDPRLTSCEPTIDDFIASLSTASSITALRTDPAYNNYRGWKKII